MLRYALTLAALYLIHALHPASIAVAQQAATAPDPIVGVWALDTVSGEKIEYVITVHADGTTKNRVVGQEFPGTWKRLQNGHYLMEPGGEDDYVVLRKGRLEEWDKTGFIRSLKRVSAGKGSSRPNRLKSDSLRREAQAWAYSVFTPGMWWKANTLQEFVDHLGRYQIIPTKLSHYKAYYFTQADLTVLMDEERGVAMHLRDGRTAQ